MSWLPVAERELRVSSRKKIISRLRTGVGALSVIPVFGVILMAGRGPIPAGVGSLLLQIIAWLALVFCLMDATRQTADSLSSERRDGTLDLLLLTRLSGFDIVFAKFVAAGITTFIAVSATFPAMGVSLLVGGATPGEFWRAQLVILDGLFLALSGGLWASARNRDASGALLCMILVTIGVWILPAGVITVPKLAEFPSISPLAGMLMSEDLFYRGNPSRFWLTLAGIHAAGWGFLLDAGRLVSVRFAVPENPQVSSRNLRLSSRGSRSSASSRMARAGRRGDAQPCAGLVRPSPKHSILVTFTLCLPLLADARFIGFLGSNPMRAGVLWLAIDVIAWFVPALILSSVLLRGFSTARREGVLDLLVCTPVPPREIVLGYWTEIQGRLRWPVFWFLGALLFREHAAAEWLASTSSLSTGIQNLYSTRAILQAGAIVWAGMWCWTSHPTSAGAVRAILFWTALLPWAGLQAFCVAGEISLPALFASTALRWNHPAVFGGSLAILLVWSYYAFLTKWASERLLNQFRETLSEHAS